jgi:hypothetical protein
VLPRWRPLTSLESPGPLKVLLDECVDVRLAHSLTVFAVRTVAERGWIGVTNGKLLSIAAGEFDVFVTVDRNLPFQQHVPKYDIAVVLILAKTNRIADLVGYIPELLTVIPTAPKRTVTRIGS